ncbi:MAG TPA: DUF4147 domain-containing protein [Gammaproteobacteria bacterium]|nr:DUF4147 domain-containing protein [Gammaproteobacteria bacterium]
MPDITDLRRSLLEIYAAALRAVRGRRVVRDYLRRNPVAGPLEMVALGKAAASMARGALDVLGEQIARALVITKYGHCDPELPLECLQAGHPLPDENSLLAGERLLKFIGSAARDRELLFLISGGSSALVEVPAPGVMLPDLRRLNRWLLGSGLDIHAMNSVRMQISRIKGGRLAGFLEGRRALNLMISDVPGDDPAIIGSGLLVPGRRPTHPPPQLPGWIQELCNRARPAPVPDASSFRGVSSALVATNRQALDAALEEGRARGFAVHSRQEFFQGDALRLGARFARRLLEGPPGLYLWGGESSVLLPSSPRRGGRCQSLALAAARVVEGRDGICFLAAGSDGSDGPGGDAGALVDGGTIARGREEGLDPVEALRRADAGSFLEASGDLVRTGPTGTNVMDLVMALKS